MNYTIKCKLWKPKENNLLIFCDLQEEIDSLSYEEVYLEDYVISYDNKKIKIFTSHYLNFLVHRSYNVPFLYSDDQTIDLSDGKNEYDLKFKVGSYYESTIFLNVDSLIQTNYFYLPVDNCKVKNDEMTCKLTRETIENKLYSIDKEPVYYFSVFNIGLYYCFKKQKYANHIIIKFNKGQQEIINIEITKLLTNAQGLRNFFVYETNVKTIPNLVTSDFYLNFAPINDTQIYKASCLFKKSDDDRPLLVLCKFIYIEDNNMTLKPFSNEIDVEHISLKYNFRLKLIKNQEIINLSGESFYIAGKYPNI